MPIDPRIVMGIQPIPVPQGDQASAIQKSLILANLLDQGEANRLTMGERRRELESNDRVRALLGENPNATPEQVMAIDPRRGMEFGKYRTEEAGKRATIAKDEALARKADAERELKQLEVGTAVLAYAKDPVSFETIMRSGMFPQNMADQALQQGYSPQLVQRLQAFGTTRAQQITAEQAAANAAETRANNPFIAGPNGPVPNQPVQAFQLSKSKASAPNVRVDVKTGDSLAQQIGPMMRDSVIAAEGAVKQVDAARRIISAVDTGKIISGPGAEPMLVANQIAQTLGIGGKDSAEIIANTRQAIRGLAELTLQGRQQMRGQGAITESEGKLAERAMSGEINFTAAEIKQLAAASERSARFQYAEHARKIEVMKQNPSLQGLSPFYQGPAMPAMPTEIADQPPAPVTTPKQGTGRIRFLGIEPGT